MYIDRCLRNAGESGVPSVDPHNGAFFSGVHSVWSLLDRHGMFDVDHAGGSVKHLVF